MAFTGKNLAYFFISAFIAALLIIYMAKVS